MTFWILIGLTVLIAGIVFYIEMHEWHGSPFMGAFITLFIGGIVSLIVSWVLALLIPQNVDLVRDSTHQLKALGNSSAQDGRFYFIGGGYINDKRVLNYISQRDGGAIHVEQADAKDSTIYEGSQGATVQVQRYDYNNGWVIPWPMGSHTEYTFRIPAGSVIESYTLDNK